MLRIDHSSSPMGRQTQPGQGSRRIEAPSSAVRSRRGLLDARLVKDDDGLICREDRPRLREQCAHDAITPSGEHILHLHRLDDAQSLPEKDDLPLRHGDRDQLARHGREQSVVEQ